MNFAEQYFKRVNTCQKHIKEPPAANTKIIVIIPSYNENKLIDTINSLYANKFSGFSVEIIVVINSAQSSPGYVVSQNKKTLSDLIKFKNLHFSNNINLFSIYVDNLPPKKAGVGLARKIGMDEALRRFSFLNNSAGLIVSLDADTLVMFNYFSAIKTLFDKKISLLAANINFEHRLTTVEFSKNICTAAVLYELYLRYYIQSLRFASHPHAFHTIGSAFVVKALVYAKYGGMVQNKSGEDFYFLQKIIPSGNFDELKTTTVFPSPRTTDRVIFGTGVAINDIIKKYNFSYPAFTFESFIILKKFLKNIPSFYFANNNIKQPTNNKILKEFLVTVKFNKKIEEIKQNTAGFNSFEKRFYSWFNAFRVLKFLNFYHDRTSGKKNIVPEAGKMLQAITGKKFYNAANMLLYLRRLQNSISAD